AAQVANSSNPAVTWSLNPNIGTVSATGVYTAPLTLSTQQTVLVTATSAADPTKSGFATVTLLPGDSGKYQYYRAITIDHTKVAEADLVNIPVLISGTFGYLATPAYGGKAQSASGYDIVFSSDPDGVNLLDHEIESYRETDGTVAFWVRAPVLSYTADTVI